jgi:hypothetical protein
MSADNSDRFDLEDAISKCWNTSDDLDLLARHIGEADIENDDLLNLVLGLKETNDLRVTRAFDIFSDLVERGRIA